MITLRTLLIYPVKGLDQVSLAASAIGDSGALLGDREFRMVDAAGRTISGKRRPEATASLRSTVDCGSRLVHLSSPTCGQASFHLDSERTALGTWLSSHFSETVTVEAAGSGSFPDDTAAPGPTVISEESIAAIATWFGLEAHEIQRRLRANLILSGGAAWCEDQLLPQAGGTGRFSIGAVSFEAVNACSRCSVPSRDSRTGAQTPGFQQIFSERRAQTVDEGRLRTAFPHFYKAALNTRVLKSQGLLALGDALSTDC